MKVFIQNAHTIYRIDKHLIKILLLVSVICGFLFLLTGCLFTSENLVEREAEEQEQEIHTPLHTLQQATRMFRDASFSPDQVIEQYERAIAEAAQDGTFAEANQVIAYAWRGIGFVYFSTGDFIRAEEALLQALNLGSIQTPVIQNLLGICAMKQMDFALALERFEEGLQLPSIHHADYQDIRHEMLHNRIVCLENLLDFRAAKEAAQELLALFPEDELILRELEFLQTR